MYRTTLLFTLAIAAISCPPARADYFGGYRNTPYAPPPPWAGLYIGAHGGSAEADFDFHTSVTSTPNQTDKGFFEGGQLGYNWQAYGNIVLGLEADASIGDLSATVRDGDIRQNNEVNAFGSARARLGYAFGILLPYVTGGLGWANATLGESCPAGAISGPCKWRGAYNVQDTENFFGWTAGGGAELALSPRWSVKAEYLHSDLGGEWFQFDPSKANPRAPDLTMDTIRGGINYRFGGYQPLK